MKSRCRPRFLVLILAITSLAVPASSSGDSSRARDVAALTDRVRSIAPPDTSLLTVQNRHAAVDRAPRDVTAALASAREELGDDAPTARLLGTAARLRAEAISGVHIAGPRPATSPNPQLSAAEDDARTYARRTVAPAGDLDGDGAHDVLTYDFVDRYGETTYEVVENRIAGVRGSDGVVLWEREMEDPWAEFAFPLGVDVTGDGRADLVRQTLTVESALPEGACTIGVCGVRDELTWNVAVLNGIDLSVAWASNIPGSVTHASAGALVGGAAYESGLASAVEVELAGDQNADGARDLIISVYDIDFTSAGAFAAIGVGGAVFADDSTIALHADVVSGRNGSSLVSRTRPAKRGAAALRPAGHSSGDGVPELVLLDASSTPRVGECAFALVVFWCNSTQISQAAIEMIDGRTGATSWTGHIERIGDDTFFVDDAAHDLNGDGIDDLVILAYENFPFVPTQLLMLDGATGARRWARTFDELVDVSLQVVGPIGGSAGQDLAEVAVQFEDTSDNFAIVVNRIDGATATLLSTTTHPFVQAEDSYSAGFATLGNIDGDETQDIVISIARARWTGDTTVEDSRVIVESGSTGTTLIDRTEAGWGGWISGGDLDGAGRDDLLNVVNDYAERQVVSLNAHFSGATGRAWSREDAYPVNIYGSYGFAVVPDMDGNAGTDIVIVRAFYDNRGDHMRYDAVTGLSGATLWGHGDEIGATPGGYSEIAGVVLNEAGDPVRDVCVGLYTSEGWPDRSDETDAAGAFSFPRLGPGPYKLEFDPCGIPGLEKEWYDDKRSFAGATEILLPNGLKLTGLGIVLSSPQVPINDDILDAISINSWPYFDRRDISLATTEPEEPACAGTKTIWYRLDSFVIDPVVFVRTTSDFSAGIAIYEGDDPRHATTVACGPSPQVFASEFGKTYWVQVGSLSGTGGSVTVRMSDRPV